MIRDNITLGVSEVSDQEGWAEDELQEEEQGLSGDTDDDTLIRCPDCQRLLRCKNLKLHTYLCRTKKMKVSRPKEFLSCGILSVNNQNNFNNLYNFKSDFLNFSIDLSASSKNNKNYIILDYIDKPLRKFEIFLTFSFPNFKVKSKPILKDDRSYLIIPNKCHNYDFVKFDVLLKLY